MKKLIVITFSLFVLAGGSVMAQSVTLDSVNVEAIYSQAVDPGYAVFEDFGDSVMTGQEMTMYFRFSAEGTAFRGYTNGWKVWTVDGNADGAATWGIATPVDTAADIQDKNTYAWQLPSFLALWEQNFRNYFSVDGMNADTATVGGFLIFASGMGEDWDAVSVELHIGALATGEASHGDSLCVDSAYYPPGGEWLWSDANNVPAPPNWDGPHCFFIIDEATGVTEAGSGQLPETFALAQNYPNPFNPTTTISFDVGRTGHVKLDVYNVLGQRVETLIDRVMERGTYEADWDASSFSTGIYFYKLETESFSDTKKMLLLK